MPARSALPPNPFWIFPWWSQRQQSRRQSKSLRSVGSWSYDDSIGCWWWLWIFFWWLWWMGAHAAWIAWSSCTRRIGRRLKPMKRQPVRWWRWDGKSYTRWSWQSATRLSWRLAAQWSPTCWFQPSFRWVEAYTLILFIAAGRGRILPRLSKWTELRTQWSSTTYPTPWLRGWRTRTSKSQSIWWRPLWFWTFQVWVFFRSLWSSRHQPRRLGECCKIQTSRQLENLSKWLRSLTVQR